MSRVALLITSIATIFALSLSLAFTGNHKDVYSPGTLFAGHERFAGACQACHDKWSRPSDAKCATCHEHLVQDDTHTADKLAHPVKAVIPDKLKAPGCVLCHKEHLPDVMPSGYTGPANFCAECHTKETMNPEHQGFDNKSCANSSCHSYHFNLGHEDYASTTSARLLPKTRKVEKPEPKERYKASAETMEAMHRSRFYKASKIASARYDLGGHNMTEATCDRCHTTQQGKFVRRPSVTVCVTCHEVQTKTFGGGRHGARATMGLALLGDEKKDVGCGSCHDVHSLRLENTRKQACVECHGSEHVSNYDKSGHARYLTDPVFNLKPMTGADCATCHMPRLEHLGGATMHNESYTSTSKWKMAKSICSRCHGLEFSLRGLYESDVVKHNFTFSPDSTAVGIEYGFQKTGVK